MQSLGIFLNAFRTKSEALNSVLTIIEIYTPDKIVPIFLTLVTPPPPIFGGLVHFSHFFYLIPTEVVVGARGIAFSFVRFSNNRMVAEDARLPDVRPAAQMT